ncbi:hypothetical protein GCM10007877_09210 [Marinibactrum halimedae]|uniref:Uncharacterized protein n=1 Tax=Marinibactrum halimedae TaxID=1444977 RepID=A0AA37WNR7_9GAMM|nr:hypothetical protein GCM10007877_09210 [Marinibactrum halimedae]
MSGIELPKLLRKHLLQYAEIHAPFQSVPKRAPIIPILIPNGNAEFMRIDEKISVKKVAF